MIGDEILSVQSFEHDLRTLINLARSEDLNGDRRKIQEIRFEVEHRTQAMIRRYYNLMRKWEANHVRS